MLHVTINGQRAQFPVGTTILQAMRHLGMAASTLGHDDRLKPSGACRLCVVEVDGWNHFATACNTALTDGMVIQTNSPAIEQTRATILGLLARNYPASDVNAQSNNQFIRALARQDLVPPPGRAGAEAGSAARSAPPLDSSHPYIQVEMAKCVTCFRCVRICDEVQGQSVWQVWHRGDTTQIRPDSGTTLLASSCVSCGACVDTCPSGALEDKTVLEFGEAEKWTRTTCPYCGVGCELTVGTRGAQIVQIKAPLDALVNKGHLCVKGRYAFGFARASDRITSPMLRVKGTWQPVAWTDAIDCIAENLLRLEKESGSDCLAILGSARATNEENYLTQKFARVVLGTNNVDCCARVCHAPTAMAMKSMLGTGAATNSFDDIEQAAAILLCGTNPTENHPIVGARIKQAVRRGAKLIVIDPRQIELARVADFHLALRPGTNVLLLNALACAIVEAGWFDEATVRTRVAEWDEFKKFIRDYAPEKVADLCGVSAALIRQAARLYATTSPAMCFHGLGVTEHSQGTEGVMCLVNLALLTGNIGRIGGGVNPLRGQNNVQGAAVMGCEPDTLTGSVSIAAGHPLIEKVWRAPVPKKWGLDLMQMIDAASEGWLRGLWAIGYDVSLTNPDTRRTGAALRRLEFVVVQDLFLNEIARECGTVFLPAAASFEKDGTFMNSERRIQRVRRAIDPPGETKTDWEIICDVARAMGHGAKFDFHSPESIWDEVREVWPAVRGITYPRLELGGLQWPCPSEDHPGTTVLHTNTFSKGVRAALQRIEHRPTRESVSSKYPFLLMTGRSLYQFNAGTMTLRTPNVVLRPTDTLDLSPRDAGRLELSDGERVVVRSRHGETVLPVKIDPAVKEGELFATFHTAKAMVNRLTGPERDRVVHTPEYKVVAVGIEKLASA